MRKFFKKIHVLVLSFVLSISNVILINQANASTAMGGWSLSNPVSKGASVLYNGAKNVLINGKNVAKTSTALITPTAQQVAKVLARGGAAYALSVAVEQLIGAGVDWVLDPANNQIKYTVPNPNNSNLFWIVEGLDYTVASTQYQACMIAVSRNPTVASDSGTWGSFQSVSNNKCVFKYRSIDLVSLPNPAYDSSKDEEKTLPLDVVANQVISNAESGDTDAQVATTAAAADIVNDAQNDSTKARPIVNQLEANAETKTEEEATGQSKPNTETGSTDLSLTFPVFCGWAPVVCEAAQVVISFPAKVEGWVSDLLGTGQKVEENTKTAAESTQAIEKELTKDDGVPLKDKTDINLPDLPITPETVNVNWGGSCPAPTTTNISFHGQSQEITILRYDFICEWAWVIKASVVALASIGAVFIISGRKT